jgi:hypothetical protein
MRRTGKRSKAWTFMVYMAGDNNLDPNGVQDLKEMKKVGSTDDLNVIAQFDRASGHVAKRYYLRKGGTVAADAVASLGKINTGDPKRLLDFVRWGIATYPAERFILVLWNHGQGWDDTDIFAAERQRSLRRLARGRIAHAFFHAPVRNALRRASRDAERRAILIDDNAKDFLDNLEMKAVLTATAKLLGRKLDVLGMDACLMSMAEVGYEIRDTAAFTVGSEQTEPLEGWPYDALLAALAKEPSMKAADLSRLIVDNYLASYPRDAVTQSACDLSKADALAAAVAGLARALTAGLSDVATVRRILAVRTQVQSFDVADNIDLVDFCLLLRDAAPGSEIARTCEDVVRAARTGYVAVEGHRGADLGNSHGVAIYFPTEAVSPLYPRLDFSQRTGWHEFLAAYLAAVRRR